MDSASLCSFADDTTIAKWISSESDIRALQADLSKIYPWATYNNMEFNAHKLECLRYGFNNSLKDCTWYTANNGKAIDVVEHVKDLRVNMSCSGTFCQSTLWMGLENLQI